METPTPNTPFCPAAICRPLLAALDASEGRRRQRKRNTSPDSIGMVIKRRLLEETVWDDPDPDAFEGWLLERSLSSAGSGSDDDEFRPSGPTRAMALEVLAEWRLAELPGAFVVGSRRERPPMTPTRVRPVLRSRGSGGGLLRLPDQLHFDRDLDFIPDQGPASFERLVPSEPKVRAIDLAAGTKPSPLRTPGVSQPALSRDIQYHFARDIADCEVPRQSKFTVQGIPLDFPAAEGNGRETRVVEEVGRTEMRIALLLAGVDARDLDRDVDKRCASVRLVYRDRPLYLAEAALTPEIVRCLTANSTCECAGSICQLVAPARAPGMPARAVEMDLMSCLSP